MLGLRLRLGSGTGVAAASRARCTAASPAIQTSAWSRSISSISITIAFPAARSSSRPLVERPVPHVRRISRRSSSSRSATRGSLLHIGREVPWPIGGGALSGSPDQGGANARVCRKLRQTRAPAAQTMRLEVRVPPSAE